MTGPIPGPDGAQDARLERLGRRTFGFFERHANPDNGLVVDNTRAGAPATVGGSGHALASYVVAAERGWVSRRQAIERTLTTLRFFARSEQSDAPDATGFRGFYYHFLEMDSGRRAPRSELSTIDSAILLAGTLVASAYFRGASAEEREIVALAEGLYRRADWRWALNGGNTVSMGWTPERGFLRYRWTGYNEALFLYVLALGSPTHPISPRGYDEWTAGHRWKRLYGHEHVYAGPLFIHQLSHVFLDLRDVRDAYMRRRGIDYFENSRRATYVQREYARRNPRGFAGYGPDEWGITASDGPGPARRAAGGATRRFWGYRARGVPYGPDDGTLAPWALVASLPFAPELVLPALEHLDRVHPEVTGEFGYKCSYNPTYREAGKREAGWISQGYYAIDQGPVVLMIENYRSGLIWRLLRDCAHVVAGLDRAGFRGGWLEAVAGGVGDARTRGGEREPVHGAA